MKKSILTRFSYALCGLLAVASSSVFGQAPSRLLISQVYGAGGNSGSTYNYDYVELYNPTATAIPLSGYSLQYASAAGTTWATIALPNKSVQPNNYFLILAASQISPAPTPNLPVTADFSAYAVGATSQPVNFSATNGKIALVASTTPLSGSCPASSSYIYLIGFGTANCFEGTAAAPAPSVTNADIRTSLTIDRVNNSTDFAAAAANPHSSASGAQAGALSATGNANPGSVTAGNTVALSVTVTPGTNPASSGVTVTGDLRLIGGSQTQAFTSAGNNTYTYTSTVNTSSSGTISLPISVADGQTRTASATISIIVNQPVATVAIDVIQGTKSKTALSLSPYAGQSVTTTGVVTAVIPAAVFIQTPDGQTDGNPLTPEGIQVYYGTGKIPAGVVVGANITVTGPVATYPALSTATVQGSSTPASEINVPVSTVINSSNNPLPAPITLTSSDLVPNGGLFQLTPYEGMRVTFSSLTTTSGTGGTLTEASETIATDGTFYAVIGNTPRPFREPGIDIRDLAVQNRPANVANFDDNPERILVDSDIAGGTSIEISTGAVLANVTGVLDFTFTADQYYDPSRLILDKTYDRSQVTAGMTIQPVQAKAANEFTVASYNIERFFNTSAADDIYKTSTLATATPTHPDLTPDAYARRLQKVSLAVRNVLNSPDVVTIEEVENQSVATDIANQINSDAGTPGLYTGLSTDNSTYYTQDGTGISVGFLVKNTVDNLGFTQFGYGETTPSGTTLNDRPFLVLSAGIKRAGATDYPVTVIVNHMKSLINVNSTTSATTRLKKELQAEDIAKYIQGLQANGKHVISGGDFNAFEFSDGYTDTLGTYTNVGLLPADQVVQPGVAGLTTPSLINLALTLPIPLRWSYVESGSAQILDQMVVTQDLANAGAHLAYAHMNADFPESATNDATTPARNSDHDAAVGYFILPTPTTSGTLTPVTANFGSNTVGTSSAGQSFTVTNTGETSLGITSVTATGDYAASNNCATSIAVTTTCSINVVLTPTAAGTRSGTLSVVTTGGTFTSTLTGQGVAGVLGTTTTTLAVSPASPVVSGTIVTLTATVSSSSEPVTAGMVNFYDTTNGSSLIGSVQLKPTGTASLNFIFGAGQHTLSAQLVGTTSFAASMSANSTLVVSPNASYPTTSLLTSTTTGSTYSLSDAVTFFGQTAPAGVVNFVDGTTGTTTTASLTSISPTLATPASYQSGGSKTASLIVATGDFNNDGIPDLAVSNLINATVGVLLGNRGGTSAFQPQVSYATGIAPYAVVVSDFNNDGNADLAVSNLASGTVSILLGNGDGTFQPQQTYNTGTTGNSSSSTTPQPYGLSVADINKDGNIDLVTTNTGEGTVSVLLGAGNGTFAAPTTTAVGGAPFVTVVADFNGDGQPDLMTVNGQSNNTSYLLGNGTGSFTPGPVANYSTGLTPYYATVGDFNKDGRPDVAISNLGDPNQPPSAGSLTILLNNAGNGFTTATYATGIEPTSVALIDFNHDGNQDLVVTNYGENTIGILTGTGTGTFNPQQTVPSIASPYELVVADFNGDGEQDLAVESFGGTSVSVQLGTQTGIYSVSGLPLPGSPDTATATYMPGANDAYATSTSNTVQIPASSPAVQKTPATRKGAVK